MRIFRAFAAAQGLDGDADVAYFVSRPGSWTIELASRIVSAGTATWTRRFVGAFPAGGAAPTAESLSLSYSSDGRLGLAYCGRTATGNGGLWVLIEGQGGTQPASIVVDTAPGACGWASAAFDSAGRLWIAYSRDLTSYEAVDGFDALAVRVKQVRRNPLGNWVVDDMGSPGRGLLPSIAIDPVTDGARVAMQTASFEILDVGDPTADWTTKVFGLLLKDRVLTSRSATGWSAESVEGLTIFALPIDEDHPIRSNLNRRSTRTTLHFTPDGVPRLTFTKNRGGLFVATRESSGWKRDLLEVVAQPGFNDVSMLDGAGRLRVIHDDDGADVRRFYREEDDRALGQASTLGLRCGKDFAYVDASIAADFDPIWADHDDFNLNVVSVQNLGAGGLDFLVTALETYDVLLESTLSDDPAVGSVQLIDLFDPEIGAAPPNPIQVDHVKIEYFTYAIAPTPSVDTPEIRARFRVRVGSASEDPELQFSVLGGGATPGDDNAVVACCDPQTEDPAACADDEPSVTACVAGALFPAPICTGTPCIATGMGTTLRDARVNLPLLPPGFVLEDDRFTADLTRMTMRFTGTAGTDLSVTAEGSAETSGRLLGRVRAGDFEFILKNVRQVAGLTDGCEGFNLTIAATGPYSDLEFESSPATESRAANPRPHRFGQPAVALPRGRFVIPDGGVVVDPTGVKTECEQLVPAALGAIEVDRRIRTALRDPKGDLEGNLNNLAEQLSRQLLVPALEDLALRALPPGTLPLLGDPRDAVVLQIDAAGNARFVYERASLPIVTP